MHTHFYLRSTGRNLNSVEFSDSGGRAKLFSGSRRSGVLKGTWYTGDGDVFDPSKTVPLKVGSFMKHPSGAHNFDGANDEEVIVELMGIGPGATTRLHPEQGLFASSKTTAAQQAFFTVNTRPR